MHHRHHHHHYHRHRLLLLLLLLLLLWATFHNHHSAMMTMEMVSSAVIILARAFAVFVFGILAIALAVGSDRGHLSQGGPIRIHLFSTLGVGSVPLTPPSGKFVRDKRS